MHYYQFNIGDYKSHTEHLSDTEDLAFRRMLDWCYLHETHLPLEIAEVARLIRMRPHTDCIANVLREFFTATDLGWVNKRVAQEIAKVGDKSNKAKESAKTRWANDSKMRTHSEGNANAMRTHSEGNANAMRTHSEGNANAMQMQCEGNATQDPRPITQDPRPITRDTRKEEQPTPKQRNSTQSELDERFGVFWETYPKHVSKKSAYDAFKKAKINGEFQAIIDDIKAKAQTQAWIKDGGQFVPNPATYLNQRRWEDDPILDAPALLWAGAV